MWPSISSIISSTPHHPAPTVSFLQHCSWAVSCHHRPLLHHQLPSFSSATLFSRSLQQETSQILHTGASCYSDGAMLQRRCMFTLPVASPHEPIFFFDSQLFDHLRDLLVSSSSTRPPLSSSTASCPWSLRNIRHHPPFSSLHPSPPTLNPLIFLRFLPSVLTVVLLSLISIARLMRLFSSHALNHECDVLPLVSSPGFEPAII